MTDLHIVVGGQFGSEGKGHVTAHLTRQLDPSDVIRVAGPNAGHTAYDHKGERWSLRQIPVAAVASDTCRLIIAPGSEIDPQVLMDEIDRLDQAGFDPYSRLLIDPQATVIQVKHRDKEASADLTGRVGSTGKGIGAARADRIMRTAKTWDEWINSRGVPKELQPLATLDSMPAAEFVTASPGKVIIEGTQGYGLGLHAGYYPFCTSSDCTAADFCSMAGLSPWSFDWVQVWPVFRTYPIRVAGNSGPLFKELDWSDLAERTGGHIQPERTTVTQKIRRVGAWDPRLAREAMIANGGHTPEGGEHISPVLTFLDYVFPELANSDSPTEWPVKVHSYLRDRSVELGVPIAAVGTGPDTIVNL